MRNQYNDADWIRIDFQLKIGALKYLHDLLITNNQFCQTLAMKIVRVDNSQFDIFEWRDLYANNMCNVATKKYSWREGFQEFLIEQYEEIFKKTKAFFN